ncbi:hypothetical protein O181_010343 [Austropuccinia psidii MF-1]|uniref:Uncharacterized protein n=1 Tax=Austropuccinia psidii MF-1 TaxID=1389203 RepID=A0A9Q3BST5_9BASI|nr:hypothetical protein [Austropuccinia psidii MF-1]
MGWSSTFLSLISDGRSAFKFWPISITTGGSAHSHGSARYRIKTTSDGVVTDVLIGCKLDVEERTFDTRASVLECSVDFSLKISFSHSSQSLLLMACW